MSYYDRDRTDAAPRVSRHPGPGLNAVAEYQQAGRPFVQVAQPADAHFDGAAGTEAFSASGAKVRGDDETIEFPFITKRVTLKNLSGADAYVYFCSLAVPAESAGDEDPTARGNVLTEDEMTAQQVGDGRVDSAVLSNGHYYTLGDDETIEMNVKCKRIYIAGNGNVRVYAELTNIVHPYNLDLRGVEGISGGIPGTVKS
jgi:hypothetical protein